MIEHPDIRECQLTGGRDTPDDTEYKCPECGATLYDNYTIYQRGAEIIGCEFCIACKEASEVSEDLTEAARFRRGKRILKII